MPRFLKCLCIFCLASVANKENCKHFFVLSYYIFLIRTCYAEELTITLLFLWLSTLQVEGLCKLISQNYRSLKSIKFIHCKFTVASFNAICDVLCMHSPQALIMQHFSIKTSSFLNNNFLSLPAGLISLLSSGRYSEFHCSFHQLLYLTVLCFILIIGS